MKYSRASPCMVVGSEWEYLQRRIRIWHVCEGRKKIPGERGIGRGCIAAHRARGNAGRGSGKREDLSKSMLDIEDGATYTE
jgi:hypothetical protein